MSLQHIVLFSFPRALSEEEAADMRAMVASWPGEIGLMTKCRFGTDLTGARTRRDGLDCRLCEGFRTTAHCGSAGRHRGRRPKASREGTRGELRYGMCRALWRFDRGAAGGRSRHGARIL